ncbi:hypothetical protein [Falsihalocynthiibacter arcticus]|uniref:Uncharacterized protein n=1 Tax=Falsihalocynthiibacter arcticus TaxID=1579316 RepID=A0A126UZX0_9RHOB|nr:hypothetical protein [Falsihalocynthiibacter arcticus]AML51622.1 hypothetical protein RC74_10420 [Falsihalocynthiibacter arcticus]
MTNVSAIKMPRFARMASSMMLHGGHGLGIEPRLKADSLARPNVFPLNNDETSRMSVKFTSSNLLN